MQEVLHEGRGDGVTGHAREIPLASGGCLLQTLVQRVTKGGIVKGGGDVVRNEEDQGDGSKRDSYTRTLSAGILCLEIQ